MLFEIKAETIKNALSAVTVLLDEPVFVFDSTGMTVRGMDPSRVCMVDMKMEKSCFVRIQTGLNAEKAEFSTNISELEKILKRCGKDENITFDTSGEKIVVTVTGKYTRNFKIPSLEAMIEEVPSPKVVFKSHSKLNAVGFKNVIKDANAVTDHLTFKVDVDKMDVVADGDLMSCLADLKIGDEVLLEVKAEEPCKATFSVSYLDEILSAVKNAELLELSVSTDMPLKLDFKNVWSAGYLCYYLAPRIECE